MVLILLRLEFGKVKKENIKILFNVILFLCFMSLGLKIYNLFNFGIFYKWILEFFINIFGFLVVGFLINLFIIFLVVWFVDKLIIKYVFGCDFWLFFC